MSKLSVFDAIVYYGGFCLSVLCVLDVWLSLVAVVLGVNSVWVFVYFVVACPFGVYGFTCSAWQVNVKYGRFLC